MLEHLYPQISGEEREQLLASHGWDADYESGVNPEELEQCILEWNRSLHAEEISERLPRMRKPSTPNSSHSRFPSANQVRHARHPAPSRPKHWAVTMRRQSAVGRSTPGHVSRSERSGAWTKASKAMGNGRVSASAPGNLHTLTLPDEGQRLAGPNVAQLDHDVAGGHPSGVSVSADPTEDLPEARVLCIR